MRALRAVLVLFQLFSIVLGVLRCEPFAGAPAQCAGVFAPGQIISLPANRTQAAVLASSPLLPYIGFISLASPACSSAAFAFYCPAELFAPCVLNASQPTARRTCQQACTGALNACSSELAQYAEELRAAGLYPNCTAIDAIGQPLYPVDTYSILQPNGTLLVVECFYANVSSLIVPCPEGLVRNDDGECNLPCPNYMLSLSEMRGIEITVSVLSFGCAIGSLFAILCALLRSHPVWHVLRWPQSASFFIFINNLLLIFAFWIGLFGGFDRVWCTADKRSQSQSHTSCAVQGTMFVFASYSSAYWVFWLSLNLCISTFFPNRIPALAVEIIAHLSSWGIPFVVTIIGLSRHRISYPGDAPYCSMADRFAFNAWLYPSAALLYTSILLLLITILYFIGHAARLGFTQQTASVQKRLRDAVQHFWAGMRGLWRLYTFTAYTAVAVGFSLGVLMYYATHQADIVNSVKEFYRCVATGTESCPRKLVVSYPLQLAAYSSLIVSGLVYGLFSSDGQNGRALRALVLRCQWPQHTPTALEEQDYSSMRDNDELSNAVDRSYVPLDER